MTENAAGKWIGKKSIFKKNELTKKILKKGDGLLAN